MNRNFFFFFASMSKFFQHHFEWKDFNLPMRWFLHPCLKSNDYIIWVCLWIPYDDISVDPHGSITVLIAKANQGK